jgi:hypothetical protein
VPARGVAARWAQLSFGISLALENQIRGTLKTFESVKGNAHDDTRRHRSYHGHRIRSRARKAGNLSRRALLLPGSGSHHDAARECWPKDRAQVSADDV